MLVPSAQMFSAWQLGQLDDTGVEMKSSQRYLATENTGGMSVQAWLMSQTGRSLLEAVLYSIDIFQ